MVQAIARLRAASEQPPPIGQQTDQQPSTSDNLSDRLREKVREANAQSETNRLSKGGGATGGRP